MTTREHVKTREHVTTREHVKTREHVMTLTDDDDIGGASGSSGQVGGPARVHPHVRGVGVVDGKGTLSRLGVVRYVMTWRQNEVFFVFQPRDFRRRNTRCHGYEATTLAWTANAWLDWLAELGWLSTRPLDHLCGCEMVCVDVRWCMWM